MKPNQRIEIVSAYLFDGSSKLWHAEISGLLAQAAILSIEHNLDAATFMATAWSAYVEARPRSGAETPPR